MSAMTEQENEQSNRKLDLASVFPSKGDPRRPPEWYGRALMYAVIAVFVGIFVYTSWFKITYVVLDVVIAMFLALAVEPLVLRLIKHGWKRGAASVTCLVSLLIIIVVLLALFGNMFVQQMISMIKGLPGLYDQFATFVNERANFKLPEINSLGSEILKNLQSSWVTNFAGQAFTTTMGVLGNLLNVITALMVAFYISIAARACVAACASGSRRIRNASSCSCGRLCRIRFRTSCSPARFSPPSMRPAPASS
ncbi:AI-2E family transporter [Bifidobacterium sp. GSD1FS]|uniref:AI-2E family transporter n=1 Tax=Bifidobacterium canis TaxID=2610880 RepID=A0A7K1J764_9BIFI|nr:AI-2E family transporter [Bifidobacterium canis]